MDHIHSVLTGPNPIARRDASDCRDEDGWLSTDICPDLPFWWTRTGYIVKWSLFLGLTTLLLVYLLVGYLHAKSRLKKGLAPLGYHRFLVARRDLARVDPRYQFPPPNNVYYYEQQPGAGAGGAAPAYGMYAMPPPPVYDPNAPRPPVYQYDVEAGAGSAQPPAGATKVDPSQSAAPVQRPADQQAEQYEAPPGPPPPPNNIPSQNTGSTNPFRN